jgi:hypothetical protein
MEELEKYGLAIMFLMSLVFAIIALIDNNQAWVMFAITSPASIYIAIMLLRPKLDLFAVTIGLTTLFLNYTGGIFDWYFITNYDKFIHGAAGFTLGYIAYLQLNKLKYINLKEKHRNFLIFVAICIIALFGFVHEFTEHVVDIIYFDRFRESLSNSLVDQIANISGSLIGIYAAHRTLNNSKKYLKRRKSISKRKRN